jgi:uncharacterized iron-regulated membrane protein
MTRNTLNFVIDIITACLMGAMIATGLLLRLVLPPGSGGFSTLWGRSRHEWGDIHFYLALAIIGILVIHMALHWKWVCVTALRCVPGCGTRSLPRAVMVNVLGIVFALVLTGVFSTFVWSATDRVQTDRELSAGHLRHLADADDAYVDDANFIRGSTTLAEAADGLNISVEDAARALRISRADPSDMRLGELCREYRFSMHDARMRLLAVPPSTQITMESDENP